MKINILTIFPEMFTPLTESMLGRAVSNGILEFNIIDIRKFAENKHNKTDDYTFGGGQGMVFMPQPVFGAMRSIESADGVESTAGTADIERTGSSAGDGAGTSLKTPRNIYLSPRGRILNKDLAAELSEEREITLLCGHYEGVDQRILDYWNFEEVSIGDYVLTGGELAAMVLIDTFARLIPGVLSGEESATDESVYSGLLEHPQFTQPRSFEEMEVPEVLLSGNHKAIRLWRFEESLKLTGERRPDLLEKYIEKHFSRTIKGRKEVLVDPTGELGKDELKVLEKFTK